MNDKIIRQPKNNYAYTTQNLRACCGHKKHTPHRLLLEKSARAVDFATTFTNQKQKQVNKH